MVVHIIIFSIVYSVSRMLHATPHEMDDVTNFRTRTVLAI